MTSDEQLRQQYGEAVRLHLWYRGSAFSIHKGKASKELADRYRRLAHQINEERVSNLLGSDQDDSVT